MQVTREDKRLQVCIFSRAYTESHPPRKLKHWAYKDTAIMLEALCGSLAESIDTILSAAKLALDSCSQEELRWDLLRNRSHLSLRDIKCPSAPNWNCKKPCRSVIVQQDNSCWFSPSF